MPDDLTVTVGAAQTEPTQASPAVATKPGWKTTEFWATVLVALSTTISAVAGILPTEYAVVATAVATAAYSIARAITKANDPTPGARSDPNAPLKPPV